MKQHCRRGVALCAAATTLSLLVAPPAQAVENGDDLGLVDRQHDAPALSSAIATIFGAGGLGSSLADGFGQLRPGTPPLAVPIILLGAMMSGMLGHLFFGRFVFEGSSRAAESLGSSTVVDRTFPSPDAPPAQFRSLEHLQDNVWLLTVYSPSMGREIENELILPAGGPENTAPRPTFYLLGGAGGGVETPWWKDGGASEFFVDKHINVVTPRGSVGSQQADWAEEDAKLGVYKWTTYLTKELPPLIDEHFHGTGRDAIAGLSMSGGPALHIAAMEDRYVAAGTYSSCPSTTGLVGQAFAYGTVRVNKGDPANMWGRVWDRAWAEHSAVRNIDDLKDKTLFLTASRGLPSKWDVEVTDSPEPLLMPDEQLAYTCTLHFLSEARRKGLNPDWYEFEEGTHNYGLFRRELVASWATLGPALGVSGG
ncbi:diacylglycerol O-acyltransferase / trehalose O-mycolyltransferase / mycolyltransferase Ag85 [Corynebacterium afermentans]